MSVVYAEMQRLSRTFFIFTAVTLLLAASFLYQLSSSSGLRRLDFESQKALDHILPHKPSPTAEAIPSPPPVPSSESPSHDPEEPLVKIQTDALQSAVPSLPPLPTPKSSDLEDSQETTRTDIPHATIPTHDPGRAHQRPHSPTNQTEDGAKDRSKTLLVEITESNGWHDEVVAALVHGFGAQKDVQLEIYQKNSRFGMADIMKKFNLSHDLPDSKSPEVFMHPPSGARDPDIVVATTCETDVIYLAKRFDALLKAKKTFLFCIVHHADRWNTPDMEAMFSPWIKKGMMDFVTLSPHTASFLKEKGLSDWHTKISRPIKSFAPVFPVGLPPLDGDDKLGGADELAFALQGNYEPTRRDFNGIFSNLKSFVDGSSKVEKPAQKSEVALHLLGSGQRPAVPDDVKEHVFFDEDLSYADFYSILSQNFALLPAFANDEYLDRKASSSVPASLLGGTPLVATKEILAAYTYLPSDTVYLREDGETELDVIRRVLKVTAKERRDKMMMVRKTCQTLVDGNVPIFGNWTSEAVHIIEKKSGYFWEHWH